MVDGIPVIDYDYCKGCGICAEVCARKAIELREENG
jgi:pyruvate ferredoxin oxidoreductase delta subunit